MASAKSAPQKGSKIAILGSGSWGTTLAWLYGQSGKRVVLWGRNEAKVADLKRTRKVDKPLNIEIPAPVAVTSDLAEALEDAHIVLFCSTSQSLRSLSEKVAGAIYPRTRPVLVSAVKGLELATLRRMSEILSETLPDCPVCALSGPNLAAEILKLKPTASVVASKSAAVASEVQRELTVKTLRLYTNADLAGVELGGTLKNIIAIAAGSSDGLELGANAKAALLTRGLAEMTRLAVALGAKPLTLAGLAGMGDLIATCTSMLSRNYRLGYEMARGQNAGEVLSGLNATAEGVPTAEAVCELSKRLAIPMPIAEQVEATLKGNTTPKAAIFNLMTRPLQSE